LIVLLMIWCGITTLFADFPVEAAEKWDWVWKAFFAAAFIPLTLRTRLRIEAAVLVMALSVAAIVISGGIKTVVGGGGYGTLSMLVRENGGIYEGSIISTVAIGVIPLILYLIRRGTIFPPSRAGTLLGAATIFACLLIPIGTEARTGLVCIAVLGVLLMRTVKYRFVYGGIAAALFVIAVPFLPASFTDRMETISGYQGDESAGTRLAVWKWTLEYVGESPFGGGFDAYRGNSFTYVTRTPVGEGNNVEYVTNEVTDEARAYHSSYFEVLGEQGIPGFLIWIVLQITGLVQMEILRRRYRAPARPDRRGRGAEDEGLADALRAQAWKGQLAVALQQSQVIFLVGSLFVGIAYQGFVLLVISLQCALWSYCRRTDPRRQGGKGGTARARRRAGAGAQGALNPAGAARGAPQGEAGDASPALN
jgi:probable O-glycosylation ligase (exosortase A-associated)